MAYRYTSFLAIGCMLVTIGCNAAAIQDNGVAEPRIHSSEELISTIVEDCFHANAMHCLQEKVLTYLDTVAGVDEDVSGRALSDDVVDKVIVDRVARILNANEIRVQLPQTFFANSVISYRADRGFDLELPQNEARDRKKDDNNKAFLPLLLLMKLKMKVVMPILMGLIGLKATKALILSKIAIKLVLGFLIYNIIQKLGGMKMTMQPMMPPMPAAEYGVPTTTASSYDPSSWEPSNGGPYARADAQYMAYNNYHPSSSSSTGSSSHSSTGSSASSSSYSSSS
uniref:Osiris 20 n=1 Tax=Stomoxys calcitrans TaxID=35570 RepID=A0A1I8NRM6_STOCA